MKKIDLDSDKFMKYYTSVCYEEIRIFSLNEMTLIFLIINR